jgi:hypothetical protein
MDASHEIRIMITSYTRAVRMTSGLDLVNLSASVLDDTKGRSRTEIRPHEKSVRKLSFHCRNCILISNPIKQQTRTRI